MTSFDTREVIFAAIQQNPGIHFRGIVELINRQIGVIEYHLHQMVKDEIIFSVTQRSHKMYFDYSWYERIDEVKVLLSNLRKIVPRQILLVLSENPESEKIPLKALASLLHTSPSGLQWHIKRLIQDNLLLPIRRGRSVAVRLNVPRDLINQLGKEVWPSRWDIFLDEIHQKFI